MELRSELARPPCRKWDSTQAREAKGLLSYPTSPHDIEHAWTDFQSLSGTCKNRAGQVKALSIRGEQDTSSARSSRPQCIFRVALGH